MCSLDAAQPFATVRNRSQPFAIVRNRSQPSARGRHGVPAGKFCKRGSLLKGKRRVASFRVAGVALRDIQTCLVPCRKSFRVASAKPVRRFQKMCCSFRGRGSTLDVSILILRGNRNIYISCVIFANRIVRATSSGDKV